MLFRMYTCIFIFFTLTKYVLSHRILFIATFPSYSHQIVFQPVWKELALRGHEVVSVTTNPIHNKTIKNLKEIDVSFGYDVWASERQNRTFIKKDSVSPKLLMKTDMENLSKISEKVFQMKEMEEIMNEKFDLVIAQAIDCAMYGFSAKYKCPLITINSLDLLFPQLNDIGNPVNPIVYPDIFFQATNYKLNFIDRLRSLDWSLWLQRHFDQEVYPRCDAQIKKYLGNDLPYIKDIIKDISINFINKNILLSSPRPILPNIVEFSGLHIQQAKPLPQDLQSFLDTADNGAIYVSFGTNIKNSMLKNKFRKIMIETFNSIPYKVLWKLDAANLTGLGENVKVCKWYPQGDILAHKNVKAFIMQGGYQSIEESIRNKVPIIGVPFIVDQPKNIQKIVELGIGKYVDKASITTDAFKQIIYEVAENITYKENIIKLANIFEDELVKPLDKIIWWIEYTLRHNGTKHLRSPYLDIPWYQQQWLDIIAFIIICQLLIIVSFIFVCKCIIRLIEQKKSKKKLN